MINEKDLSITTIRTGIKLKMIITHKPSWIIVSGEGIGTHRLRVKLIKELELKLEGR